LGIKRFKIYWFFRKLYDRYLRKKDESLIPQGFYCYSISKTGKLIPCPYYESREDLLEQENGYCSFLAKSDWDLNEETGDVQWLNGKTKEPSTKTKAHKIPISLLRDMCKECGINEDDSDENLE